MVTFAVVYVFAGEDMPSSSRTFLVSSPTEALLNPENGSDLEYSDEGEAYIPPRRRTKDKKRVNDNNNDKKGANDTDNENVLDYFYDNCDERAETGRGQGQK
ncbi:hypothetical protein EVAR_103043_1 [Eumeta japonica]|uniref:Uncharacterized protein n=1 Tax=Eumeta variegata TaxID=151549 RepID=A0A4C1WBB0_EUMVA|nr:hypothetical protein EVAR_103043_1 [Eumeta japonica]